MALAGPDSLPELRNGLGLIAARRKVGYDAKLGHL